MMTSATPVFVTGNKRKIIEAKAVFKRMGLQLDTAAIEIDEMQHHDPQKITEAKARAAYEKLQKPVLVNDSSWRIPALNGFPGGYMKDVMQWFSADDFLALMRDKKDRSITLIDVTAFYDGSTYKIFTYVWEGEFVRQPKGEADNGLDCVIREKGKTITAAEEYNKLDTNPDTEIEKYEGMWTECAEWLKERMK